MQSYSFSEKGRNAELHLTDDGALRGKVEVDYFGQEALKYATGRDEAGRGGPPERA